MVGDLVSDVLAGLNAGCRSILVKSGREAPPGPDQEVIAGRCLVVPDFAAAAETILHAQGTHP
jgi:phosphoglycolate phosphatase-like HAD superfamily hydrolase